MELGYKGKPGKRLQRADKLGCRAAVIVGEDELKRGTAMVKDLDTGEQAEVPLAALKDRLAPHR